MKCPNCKIKMNLKMDDELNEKYYDCETCGYNILQSLTKIKISKETMDILKYS